MINTPGNHSKIMHQRDLSDSPYRHIQSKVLSRNQIGQGQYWRRRAKQLQSDVLGLNQEILFLNRKLQKLDELEEKIEVLLAQNSHLVDENESLIRLIQQKKTDVEMWRARFEGQHDNASIAEAEKRKIFDHLNIKDQEHQVQIDKLLAEVSRLHDEHANLENLKQMEINQLKNKYENEAMNQIQNLKRSQYGNNELQQLNIKKLKDTLEEREFEIENLKREGKIDNERLNGEISYLKNEIRKMENQKAHELDLIRTENENTKNNLVRNNRKREEELKNLHEAKLKRMNYELEEKKNEIEDFYGKAKRGGKENEADLNQLVGQKTKLRIEMKENDNKNRNRIAELTSYYENLLQDLRQNDQDRERNLTSYYDTEIESLKEVIKAKQQEIERLLDLNKFLRENEDARLNDIKDNNNELKNKVGEIIKHYEREVDLMKIKVSQLYEADVESLKSLLRNEMANHNRQVENLKEMEDNLRTKLANAVQEKIDLRTDYEHRLNDFKIVHERDCGQMRDQITMHEKNYENQTSKGTALNISQNDFAQKQTNTHKSLMNENRTLEKQIQNKNKEIEALNLKVQKLEGYHKKEIQKLEEDIVKLKNSHLDWVDKKTQQDEDWNRERGELKERAHQLELKNKRQMDAAENNEEKLKKEIENKNIQIAELRGVIQEMQKKIKVLGTDLNVASEGAEKARLDHETLLNTEKDKYNDSKEKDRHLRNSENNRVLEKERREKADLKKQNDILREEKHAWKIRESDYKSEIGTLLDSLNKRSQLEENVINIGLSNNYFKNVAEIFKKVIDK